MKSKKEGKTSGQELDDFLLHIGHKLKEYRKAAGYSSYEQFAFEKGIARAQYGQYEKGTEDMRLSSLFKTLKALGVSWKDFFSALEISQTQEKSNTSHVSD